MLFNMSNEGTTPSNGVSGRKPTVPAVARAALVLEAVSDSAAGLSLSEVARAIRAPKSSCLSVCNTLVEAGLLTRSDTGSYRLGWKVVRLARVYLARSDLTTEFHRVDAELGLLTGETVLLSVLDGRHVLHTAARHGTGPVDVHHDVGLRLPAHCTASGKAMLAELSTHELRSRYGDHRIEALTQHSITSMAALGRELGRTRARHYALDDEETALGVLGVGVAVTDGTGRPLGALSVSVVKATVDPSRGRYIAGSLLRMAHALTARLGGPVHPAGAVETPVLLENRRP
jgi:DNA-binding IclR family transcriptional regulator